MNIICFLFGHKEQEISLIGGQWEVFSSDDYPFLGYCFRCGKRIKTKIDYIKPVEVQEVCGLPKYKITAYNKKGVKIKNNVFNDKKA
jgi:hypothetical protein